MVQVLDHLLEADQRLTIPGIGRRMIDGYQRGVAVFFHGQLVGQIENARFVGFNGSVAHDVIILVRITAIGLYQIGK